MSSRRHFLKAAAAATAAAVVAPQLGGCKAEPGADAGAAAQGVAAGACAFQDGHIDYDELDAFFTVNKKLADRYGMQCWTNAENFDRDMPINFLPIKFDKLRMKLEAAARCGYDKAITFEFSHFMSPQSAYLQAGHLYDRYREYYGI